MLSPSRGVLRLVRAGAWTSAALALTIGAHVLGGGSLPSAGGLVLTALALVWTGLMLTRWRLGHVTLTASLGATQAVLHAILTAAESSPACSAASGHHDAVLSCAAGTPAAHHHTGAAMLVAHAAATLLLVLLMARGEDSLWVLAGLLVPRLPKAPSLPSLERPGPVTSPITGLVPSLPPLGGVGRRGPPRWPAPVIA